MFRRCTESVDTGVISSRLLQCACTLWAVVQFNSTPLCSIYLCMKYQPGPLMGLPLSSTALSGKMSSQSERDDEREGDERKQQSSHCGRRDTCFLYEMRPNLQENFFRGDCCSVAGLEPRRHCKTHTGGTQALTNSDDEMKNLIFKTKSTLLKLQGLNERDADTHKH